MARARPAFEAKRVPAAPPGRHAEAEKAANKAPRKERRKLERARAILSPVNQLLPTRAALLSAAALLLPAPLLAAPAGDLLAVDVQGRPVPGVRLELIDTQLGVYGAPGPREILTTGEDGRVEVPDAPVLPLDVRAERGQGWCVSFVHGARRVDETQPMDLVGAQPRVLTLEDTTAVVLERTGTLVVEMAGAKEDDVYHVTFVDDRPEPFSHRSVRATRTFRGARGEFDLPPGRGTLYVCEEGTLGAPALSGAPGGGTAPYLVSVHPGGTTRVELRMVDGPFTTVMAPFEQIPFETLEAIAPDGATVVGSFSFLESPLRLAARLPIAMGTGYETDAHLGVRMPKHFLRAAGVPLVRPKPELPLGAPERTTAPPPLDLTFTADLGGKLRLPEMESGWVLLATNAALIRGGPAAGLQTRFVEQARLGVIELPPRADHRVPRRGQTLPPLPAEPSWTSWLSVRSAEGAPAPFQEIFVSLRDGTLARGLTDASGHLEVRGVRDAGALAAPMGALGLRVELTEASTAEEPALLTLPAGSGAISGQWVREKDGPTVVGVVVGLLPMTEDEVRTRSRFMTRAFPVAITDRNGAFAFSGLEPGKYELRAGPAGAIEIEVTAGGEVRELRLVGMNADITLEESGG